LQGKPKPQPIEAKQGKEGQPIYEQGFLVYLKNWFIFAAVH